MILCAGSRLPNPLGVEYWDRKVKGNFIIKVTEDNIVDTPHAVRKVGTRLLD